MSSDTPTILKKILARKHEEIAERSALVSIAQLIEKVQSAEKPRGFAAALAAKLAAGPPIALAQSKRMLNNSMNVTLEEALDDEGVAQTVNFGTKDTPEAIAAWMEKRNPVFKGR